MEANGFKREIPDDDGERYKLPPAEYYKNASADLGSDGVRDRVRAIIREAELGRRYSILVYQVTSASWSNLDPS